MNDENMIRAAFEEYNKILLDSLPKDLEDEESAPDTSLTRIISKRSNGRETIKRLSRYAAVLILTFSVIFGIAQKADGLSYIYDRLCIESYKLFSSVTVNDQSPLVQFGGITPSYVANGYVETERLSTPVCLICSYENGEEGKITYIQHIAQNSTAVINTQSADYDLATVNGLQAMVCQNETEASIIFATDRYLFSIAGNAPQNELLKMAETIAKKGA